MQFGKSFLSEISKRIWNRELTYADTIIIGDNSSGKSLLLKLTVMEAGDTDSVYFIDAVNRGFDVRMAVKDNKKPEYKSSILKMRLDEEHFNVRDSFNCYGTVTERIEQIYFLYEDRLQRLFERLTEDPFRIGPDHVLGEVEFKKGKGTLSSGYQALVRLLLELLYYQEQCITEKHLEHALVIIDELDEFLSPGYAYKIFPFLKEKFPQMEFVIATHSCDLVAGTQKANLIILDDFGCEVLDAGDYSSVSEVQIIFDRLYGEHLTQTSETEQRLRRLLNNRINMVWTDQDQRNLEDLKKERLTASQKLILRQITEW